MSNPYCIRTKNKQLVELALVVEQGQVAVEVVTKFSLDACETLTLGFHQPLPAWMDKICLKVRDCLIPRERDTALIVPPSDELVWTAELTSELDDGTYSVWLMLASFFEIGVLNVGINLEELREKLVRRTIGLHPAVIHFLEEAAAVRGNDFSAMVRHALYEWCSQQGYDPHNERPVRRTDGGQLDQVTEQRNAPQES